MSSGEFDRSKLSYVAGIGFMSIMLFFVFFMGDKDDIFVHAIICLVLACLMVFFFLFDEIWFMVNMADRSDDPEAFHTKVKRGSNFFSGILLMGLAGIIIIVSKDYSLWKGLHIMILTLLVAFSMFLLIYSMFLGTED